MDSLTTGATLSWLIVAAIGLSPMLVFFIADIIGRVLRGKWRERQPGSPAVGKAENKQRPSRVEAPPV
jgi:hypothetical protein